MKHNQIPQEEQKAIRLENTSDSFSSDFQAGRLRKSAIISACKTAVANGFEFTFYCPVPCKEG